jgi:hypothetical protein
MTYPGQDTTTKSANALSRPQQKDYHPTKKAAIGGGVASFLAIGLSPLLGWAIKSEAELVPGGKSGMVTRLLGLQIVVDACEASGADAFNKQRSIVLAMCNLFMAPPAQARALTGQPSGGCLVPRRGG